MRRLPIAAGLLLISVSAWADMYPDASNAKLPEARQNLELGTVRSEGSNPPNEDAVTRFYTYGYPNPVKQYEIASHPGANEYALEQAGLGAPAGVGVGQGATRVCTAPYSNNQVNCNYVAYGRLGQHRFGNGAGFQFETENLGLGSSTGWLKALSSDDETARLWAQGATDVALEFKAKGNGDVFFKNDAGGTLATMENAGSGLTDSYMRLVSALSPSANPRVQAGSATAANVSIDLRAKGTGGVTVMNDNGTIGQFTYSGTGPTTNWIELKGSTGTLASIGSRSLSVTNVPIYMVAQGAGGIIFANQDDVDGGNNILSLSGSGPGSHPFGITQQSATGVGSIGSSGGAFNMYGFRHPMSPQTASNISVTIPDTGKHYNNIGSTVTNNFILPQTTATSAGTHYCFHRDAAQQLKITANATDQIAIGATNSALGGTVTSAAGALANFASICLETHRAGQWITVSTPDKAQWTIP